MPLSEYDMICVTSCDKPEHDCGSRGARGCAYLVATRHNQNLRNYLPRGYKQNTCGVEEVPLWHRSENMTEFNEAVSGYSEPWLDKERSIVKRLGS